MAPSFISFYLRAVERVFMRRDSEQAVKGYRPPLKLRLAALQMLLEWLVLGEVLTADPLIGVRRRIRLFGEKEAQASNEKLTRD